MASRASAAGSRAVGMLIMVLHHCLLELVRAYLWLERKLCNLRIRQMAMMSVRGGGEVEEEGTKKRDDDRLKLPASLAYVLDPRNRNDWDERVVDIIAACWRRRDHIHTLCLHGSISKTCMERVMHIWSDAPITFYENEALLRASTGKEVIGGQGPGQDSSEFCIIFATYGRGHSYFAKRLDQAKRQGLGRRRAESGLEHGAGMKDQLVQHQQAASPGVDVEFPLCTQEDLLALVRPFPLLDLVICEDPDHFNLSPLLAVTIGFAQLYHCMSAGGRAGDKLEEALVAYGQSKQNYGK